MNQLLKYGLIATVAITGYTAWRDAQVATPDAVDLAPHSASTPGAGDAQAQAALAVAVALEAHPGPVVDLFTPRLWLREPPPKAVKAASASKQPLAAASAPALPFEFSGLWVEGPIRYVVLVLHDQQFLLCNQCTTQGSLHPGDVLLGQYRLESLDANQAVFTYLPLKQRQSLTLESL